MITYGKFKYYKISHRKKKKLEERGVGEEKKNKKGAKDENQVGSSIKRKRGREREGVGWVG